MLAVNRVRPIPRYKDAPTALDYHEIPVDSCDPRADEPLVDLADYGVAGSGFYARDDGLNAPYERAFKSASHRIQARRSVEERLAHINETIAEVRMELLAFNAYRPLALQQELWDFFIERSGDVLDSPTEADRVTFAGKYCSDPRQFDPDEPRTWPTHITGGAVDLTLRSTVDGEPLFMGGIFDDPDTLSHAAHFEMVLAQRGGDELALPLSYREALRNRRVLYWLMIGAGFASYAYEWWHYDLGTQMWVANGGAVSDGERPRVAWYGPAALAA